MRRTGAALRHCCGTLAIGPFRRSQAPLLTRKRQDAKMAGPSAEYMADPPLDAVSDQNDPQLTSKAFADRSTPAVPHPAYHVSGVPCMTKAVSTIWRATRSCAFECSAILASWR